MDLRWPLGLYELKLKSLVKFILCIEGEIRKYSLLFLCYIIVLRMSVLVTLCMLSIFYVLIQ